MRSMNQRQQKTQRERERERETERDRERALTLDSWRCLIKGMVSTWEPAVRRHQAVTPLLNSLCACHVKRHCYGELHRSSALRFCVCVRHPPSVCVCVCVFEESS